MILDDRLRAASWTPLRGGDHPLVPSEAGAKVAALRSEVVNPPEHSRPLAPPSLDGPVRRLEESRGELAKAWLVRLVGHSSLEEIERLPTQKIAHELPALIADIARALHEPVPDPAVQRLEFATRLAEVSGQEGIAAPKLVRDLATLQQVIIGGLESGVGHDPRGTLDAVEQVAELFSQIQADVIEEVLRTRSRELEWLGSTDSLTGLHNARFLQQHIHHLLGVQKRYGHPFAVLLIDIDGLKRINDAYGKVAGDRALTSVAMALGEQLRNVDTPIRMGGDEFCILLPHQTAARGRVVAERVADAIEAVESPTGQPMNVSIGVVSCPQDAAEAEELLEVADAAMYRAKAAGSRLGFALDAGAANGNGEAG
jgi:diguanylate cyclase (GGDEF)-like protein